MKTGRPMTADGMLTEFLMEIQATAMEGAENGESESIKKFARIAEIACAANAVNTGVKCGDVFLRQYLEHLLGGYSESVF